VGLSRIHVAMLAMPVVLDAVLWTGWRVALIAAAVYVTAKCSGIAAGSGIPDMKCILSGYDLPDHVSGWTGFAKASGLVLACGSGLPVGREGPLVHIAGCLASWLLGWPWFARLAASKERTYQVGRAACACALLGDDCLSRQQMHHPQPI
jgi:H+/Cl- antiporter ClcA